MNGQPLTPADLAKWAARAKAAHLELCRRDINAFVEYVIKDDETQRPVKQGAIQRKLHMLASKHRRVAIMSMPESGKTKNLVVARTLFELGLNPNLRFVFLCQSAEKARKTLHAVSKLIVESKELHEVFPNLKLCPDAPQTVTQLTVVRTTPAADPSIQAFGRMSDITGARIDRLIVDDLLTSSNTATKHQRDAIFNFFFNTLPSRLTGSARLIILANAWHPDDLVHRLEANEKAGNTAWHVERIPVLDEQGEPVWPEQWPLSRIEDKRIEVGALQFAREMLCQARADSEARFRSDYLELACQVGEGMQPATCLEDIRAPDASEINDHTLRLALEMYGRTGTWTIPGCGIFMGVDLAFAKHSQADETAIVTIMVYPNGLRQLLHVTSGRGWGLEETCAKIKELYEAFRPTKIMIENNGAQTLLVQHLGDTTSLPIVPYTTGAAKSDPTLGIEGIAGAMSMGRWAVPSNLGTVRSIQDGQISKLVEECLYYTPEKHTGDRLMALWFADTCARQCLNPRGRVSVMSFTPERKAPTTTAGVAKAAKQREAARKLREDLKAEAQLSRQRPWMR